MWARRLLSCVFTSLTQPGGVFAEAGNPGSMWKSVARRSSSWPVVHQKRVSDRLTEALMHDWAAAIYLKLNQVGIKLKMIELEREMRNRPFQVIVCWILQLELSLISYQER
jgi:hypothetical protein